MRGHRPCHTVCPWMQNTAAKSEISPFQEIECTVLTFRVSEGGDTGTVPVCWVRTDRFGGHNNCRNTEQPDRRVIEIAVSNVGQSCLAHVVTLTQPSGPPGLAPGPGDHLLAVLPATPVCSQIPASSVCPVV